MKEKILNNIEDPATLERLYLSDSFSFRAAIVELEGQLSGNTVFECWKARFLYEEEAHEPINHYMETYQVWYKKSLFKVFAAVILSFILLEIPNIFGQTNEFNFYLKYAGLILFLGLSVFTLLTSTESKLWQWLSIAGLAVGLGIYMELLPYSAGDDIFDLISLHLPILLWLCYGIVFIGFDLKNIEKRGTFIRYNGSWLIVGILLLLTGLMFTGIGYLLFNTVGVWLDDAFEKHIVNLGAAAVPIFASWIVARNPLEKLVHIIATIFCPLMLAILLAFAGTLFFGNPDLTQDRDLLLIMNIILLIVTALCIFASTGNSISSFRRFMRILLATLVIITMLLDIVALWAILYRVGEYGFTPNRTAVLGVNVLVLGNLSLIAVELIKVIFGKGDMYRIERTTSAYLPVYAVWLLVVIFVFPILF